MSPWHIARRSDKSLGDLASMFSSIVQGWINYHGRFYKSMYRPEQGFFQFVGVHR